MIVSLIRTVIFLRLEAENIKLVMSGVLGDFVFFKCMADTNHQTLGCGQTKRELSVASRLLEHGHTNSCAELAFLSWIVHTRSSTSILSNSLQATESER